MEKEQKKAGSWRMLQSQYGVEVTRMMLKDKSLILASFLLVEPTDQYCTGKVFQIYLSFEGGYNGERTEESGLLTDVAKPIRGGSNTDD